MITQQGIEVNVDKCEPSYPLGSKITKKKVQDLNGMLVAFSRFLQKIANQT